MKTLTLILFLLIQSIVVSQNSYKTERVDYSRTEFMEQINNQLETIRYKWNINWIYFKPFIYDAVWTKSDPPPPPFLSSMNTDTVKIDTMTFKSLVVITDEDFFNFHERNNNEKTYKRRMRKFGIGIIFSAPYKWENDTMAYINYEIIDWDFDCGTGKYGIIEIK